MHKVKSRLVGKKKRHNHLNRKTQPTHVPPTKEKIFIVGDLMVKNLHGWMMSRTKTVKVHSFSGSTVQDMEYFVEPLLARYPDHIILHVGTNNLSDESMTADRIADNIFQLANKIEEHGIKCTISELITRRDENNEKVKLVNKKLEERKSETNIGLVKHDNIVSNHLNYGGLHLNRRGDGALALNMINCIRN